MIEKNKNGIVVIVLLATFFGFVSGMVGSLTVKSYFGTGSPFWGELDFVNGNLSRPNVIISGAKKVVVAQDEKINETINNVQNSLVGIYKKKATSTKKDIIDLDLFYKIGDELGSGLIVSSDGWIISDALNPGEFLESNKDINIKKYIVITNDKKKYKIDKVEVDKASGFIFLHINARDLPVINIANQNMIKAGETVLGLNLSGDTFVSSVYSVKDSGNYLSMSSDFYYDKIELLDSLNEAFYSSFIFDVSGQIVSFVSKKGEIIPSRIFNGAIESLFSKGVISRPSLGLKYSDISHLLYSGISNNSASYDGALVVGPISRKENIAWSESGLEKGDLIISFDGIELDKDNNLSKILMNYSPGDEVDLEVLRGGEKLIITVKLAELG